MEDGVRSALPRGWAADRVRIVAVLEVLEGGAERLQVRVERADRGLQLGARGGGDLLASGQRAEPESDRDEHASRLLESGARLARVPGCHLRFAIEQQPVELGGL